MSFVAKTAYENCPNDEERESFKLPEYLVKMLKNGWIGQKSGQGFYKKIDKGIIHSIDFKSLEYSTQNKKRYSSVRIAKESVNPIDKFNSLINGDDVAAEFIWSVTSRVLLYSANRLDEISDDIVNIDNAMKWGFAWDVGPFKLWDNIGLVESIDRMKLGNKNIPKWITKMISQGNTQFYKNIDGKDCYYDHVAETYKPVRLNSKELTFSYLKNNNMLIKKKWSASLVDLDDGVAGLEFHSVLKADLNPIDGSIMESIQYAINWVRDNGYSGLVISGDSTNFSAGENLTYSNARRKIQEG